VMETVAEQASPVQTWASVQRGDVIAVSVSDATSPSFLGTFNFKNYTFHTNQAWKCSSRYVAGWSDSNFDDSEWEFARRRIVSKDVFAKHLGNYVNEAVPIWAGSTEGLFCRFRVGGFKNALYTANMAGFNFFNSVFNHGKVGDFKGTAQVKCGSAVAVSFKDSAYTKEAQTFLSFTSTANGSRLRTLRVSMATAEEAAKAYRGASFSTDRGVAPYEDGGKMLRRRRIVTDDGLLVSGKPLACSDDFVDVWFQVKDNTLSIGSGTTVGSSILLSYSADSVGQIAFFGFSNVWGNKGARPATTRVRNISWSPRGQAPKSVSSAH